MRLSEAPFSSGAKCSIPKTFPSLKEEPNSVVAPFIDQERELPPVLLILNEMVFTSFAFSDSEICPGE